MRHRTEQPSCRVRCWHAGPDATPSGLSHRLSSHQGGLRERKRVKNLGRAKKPSPALGATALSGGGRFLGKPTIAEGAGRPWMMFLRQCGTYPGRDVSLVLVCLVCFWSAAALRTYTRSQVHGRPTRQTTYTYALLPIPARTTYISWMSCHVYLICADVPQDSYE